MTANNRSFRFNVLAATLALAFASAAGAQQAARLQPAQSGDLVPTRVVESGRIAAPDLERAPVQFFHPLSADETVSAYHEPFKAESREYWQQVDGGQLRDGYALALTSPGAVVMISPGVEAHPLQRQQLTVSSGGRVFNADTATETLADADALRQAGLDVNAGTIAFKLRPGHEGDARVHVAGAEGRYVLHVLEPQSRNVLRAQAGVDVVHAGGELEVRVALEGGAAIDAISGLLVSPDGVAYDLQFAAADRKAPSERVGTLRTPARIAAVPGLWDVRATVAGNDGQRAFQRDVRTAVAVVAPTARLAGDATVQVMRTGGIDTRFGVEVGTAGRYEIRAVMYATSAKHGGMVPVGVSYSAAWLEPGAQALALNWPASILAEYSAPYAIRDLRLTDQGGVATLERRAEALHIE
jgi:hypothetical protein